MLCAGLTVYSPLVRLGCGPGKKVAIVGVGGLGHFAVMFAKALGAEVTVISHTPGKEEDATKLGAKHFIDSNKKDWHKDHAFEFDFLLNATDATHLFTLSDYFSILRVNGTFHNVGLPDHPIKELNLGEFTANGCYMGTSHLGNREEMISMLELAAKEDMKPWIEEIKISEEGCKEALENLKAKKVRYRTTLTGFDEAFGKRS